MKRVKLVVLGLAFLLAGARSASASAILYFNDLNLGTDRMAQALASPTITGSHTVTTASSLANFTTLLNGGGFQLAILFQQNFATDAAWDAAWAAVATQLASGNAAIGDDWTLTPAHITPFGASFTGNTNNAVVTVTAPGLLPGIVNPVNLTNPGWGTFSTGLNALAGATCGATFSNGQCAITITNNGRSFFNGFLADTFTDGPEGVNLYINEITAALAAQSAPTAVPEPATLVLLGSGLAVAARRRLRRTA